MWIHKCNFVNQFNSSNSLEHIWFVDFLVSAVVVKNCKSSFHRAALVQILLIAKFWHKNHHPNPTSKMADHPSKTHFPLGSKSLKKGSISNMSVLKKSCKSVPTFLSGITSPVGLAKNLWKSIFYFLLRRCLKAEVRHTIHQRPLLPHLSPHKKWVSSKSCFIFNPNALWETRMNLSKLLKSLARTKAGNERNIVSFGSMNWVRSL